MKHSRYLHGRSGSVLVLSIDRRVDVRSQRYERGIHGHRLVESACFHLAEGESMMALTMRVPSCGRLKQLLKESEHVILRHNWCLCEVRGLGIVMQSARYFRMWLSSR